VTWVFELYKTQPIAHAICVLAFVCVVGMALGSFKFRGIGLGTAGVLFAGILAGQFGEAVDPRTLDFVKDFGLICLFLPWACSLVPASLRRSVSKASK
jgi:putative transport protein